MAITLASLALASHVRSLPPPPDTLLAEPIAIDAELATTTAADETSDDGDGLDLEALEPAVAGDVASDVGSVGDSGDAAAVELHRWTHDDVVAALMGRSVMVRRIVYCEVGRSGRFDPYAVGSLGEVGPAQLLPGRGNGLSIFYGWGYWDPNSPWQAVSFIEDVERGRDRVTLRSQYPRTMLGCAGSP